MRQTNKKVDKVKSAKCRIRLAGFFLTVAVISLIIGWRQLEEVFRIMIGDTSMHRDPMKLASILIIYGGFFLVFAILTVIFWRTEEKKFFECIEDTERSYEDRLKKFYEDRLKKQKDELVAEAKESANLRLNIATLFGFKDRLKKDEWRFLKALLVQNRDELKDSKEGLITTLSEEKMEILMRICNEYELNEDQEQHYKEYLESLNLYELDCFINYASGSTKVFPEMQKMVFAKAPNVTALELALPEQED